MPTHRYDWDARVAAIQQGLPAAYARLVRTAETGESPDAPLVARFVAATYRRGGRGFDPFDLSLIDVAASDDILLCIEAIRWGQSQLFQLITDGERRVRRLWEAQRDEASTA